MDPKNIPDRIPEDFFLPANSGGFFHRDVVLEGVAVIPVFFPILQEFFAGISGGQEFLCLLWIPQESGVFRRIPVPAKSFVGCCQPTNHYPTCSPTSKLTVDLHSEALPSLL